MRRTHIVNGYQAQPPVPSRILEEENTRLEDELSGKVKDLKHLTIEIGHEVREQNKFLKQMDDEFDSSGNLLSSSLARLKGLHKSGAYKFILYILLFALFVFFICWIILKIR